jgi:hypothetical protein
LALLISAPPSCAQAKSTGLLPLVGSLWKVAPLKLAPSRIALLKTMPWSFAPAKLAFGMIAPPKFAPCNATLAKVALVRIAF